MVFLLVYDTQYYVALQYRKQKLVVSKPVKWSIESDWERFRASFWRVGIDKENIDSV